MNIAVLCPGPSLPRTFDPDAPYAALVGVNRAVTFTRCDWIASFDASTLLSLAMPHTKVFTRQGYLSDYMLGKYDGVTLERIIVHFPGLALGRVGMFTACGALLLAAWLGAGTIDVYGSDWTDAPDFDGDRTAGTWRVAERWRRESKVWAGVCDRLDNDGVKVNRIT